MLSCEKFYESLTAAGVNYFAGVPDSLLKDICAYISDCAPPADHTITANEGAAVALAAGVHLANESVPLVYLQNSGLGNLVNPLTSLVDPEVYAIPMLLLIGWRGEPGVPDEPQHRKQGRITPTLLDNLEIPWMEVPTDDQEARKQVFESVELARKRSGPVALLVRKGTFRSYKLSGTPANSYPLSREDAIHLILENISPSDVVVSTTGMASREVFEFRARRGQGHGRDFLTVGCMGHASQIALGIASRLSSKNVYCLDGDGAAIMHLGSLAIVGASGQQNFRHIVINNGAHDSVGGQPTVGMQMDIPGVARSCNYKWAKTTSHPEELSELLRDLNETDGPALLEIRVNKGARADLGRPTTMPVENKEAFMSCLKEGRGA